jgi:hypothetical protein
MGFKVKFRDAGGNEHEIPPDRIRRASWRGPDGTEHDVDGHAYRIRFLAQDPEVEGHAFRVRWRDDQGNEHDVTGLLRITYFDDAGNDKEVEAHVGG